MEVGKTIRRKIFYLEIANLQKQMPVVFPPEELLKIKVKIAGSIKIVFEEDCRLDEIVKREVLLLFECLFPESKQTF